MSASAGLARELEAKVQPLSRRCIRAMYEDPFWMARFGERGRRHAEEDSEYHVKYVVAALREGDVTVFENYARWLRGVLASRGMCSWHLTESFRQLAQAMHDEGVPDPGPALSVLRSGAAALDYSAGRAAPLAARNAELTLLREAMGGVAYRLDELWSFLLDALDRDDAPAFRAHVDFLGRAMAADAAEAARLAGTLRALRELLSGEALVLAARFFSVSPGY